MKENLDPPVQGMHDLQSKTDKTASLSSRLHYTLRMPWQTESIEIIKCYLLIHIMERSDHMKLKPINNEISQNETE